MPQPRHCWVVSDAEAGLFEYASPETPSIDGELKNRPEDFVVNELHHPKAQHGPDDHRRPQSLLSPVCVDAVALLAAAGSGNDDGMCGGGGGEGDGGALAVAMAAATQMTAAEVGGGGPCVVEFVLHKCGLGTADALRELSDQLGLPVSGRW